MKLDLTPTTDSLYRLEQAVQRTLDSGEPAEAKPETKDRIETFVADVEQWQTLLHARTLAQFEAKLPLDSLGKAVRCVLLLSTLRTWGKNIPPPLLESRVRFGLWQPEQALTYVVALEHIQESEDENFQSEALDVLAPYLPSELLPQALEIAQNISDDEYPFTRYNALACLAPLLSTELLQQALVSAQSIAEEEVRFQALAVLASYLPAEQSTPILQQVLESIQTLAFESTRAKALSTFACHAPPKHLQAVLDGVQGMRIEEARTEVLTAIAEQIQGDQVALCLQLLDALAQETRTTAMTILTPLSPVLREMGGDETMGEIFRAMEEVEHRWP